MAGPFDYTLQQPNIAGSLAGGIQAGAQIGAAMDARKQQELAAAQAEQYRADLTGYINNPTATGAAAMIAKYPSQREAVQASWGTYSQGQKDDLLSKGTQAYSAIASGKPEYAKQILDDQITAMENAGQDVTSFKTLRNTLDQDPKAVQASLGLVMSSVDPDRWSKIAGEQREAQLAPEKLTEAQAKASKAATDAKFAESAAVQDLQKGGWEIQKLANDINISKLNSQIAAMNAATAREGNDIKKQEMQLKLDEKIAKRDDTIRTKTADIASGRSTIDNFLNTADKVLKTPSGVLESAAGPVSSKLPTLSSDTADLEETLTTLGSQAFLSQVPSMKGLGALTEAEGAKLQSSLANLSLRQSPAKILENVREAQRLMLKARSNLSDKYGVPDTIPDRPALESQPASSGFKVLGVE
ncbi:hypothetical protein D9M71_161930 [compost metagenome]